MLAKIILFVFTITICYQIVTNADEEPKLSDVFGNASEIDIVRFLIDLGWSEAKLETLTGTIKELNDEDNVTVIAWQNIYKEDKTLKEIRTLEVTFPQKETKAKDDDDDDDEIDDFMDNFDITKKVNEVSNFFKLLEEIGLPTQMTYEIYNKKGELESEVYMDNNNLYVLNDDDGISYLNRTIVTTPSEMEQILKSQKDVPNVYTSILKFDVDGKLKNDSTIVPWTFVSVSDVTKASTQEVKIIVDTFVEAYHYYPDEIPKRIVEKLTPDLPKYYWFVTQETDGTYVTRDVSVSLQYDYSYDYLSADGKPIVYTIYGTEKSESQ